MSTPTTIEEWLARFDLSRFATTFRDNGIDLDVLARLGDDDLRELGLSIGDRKRVLPAVSGSPRRVAPPPRRPSAGNGRRRTPAAHGNVLRPRRFDGTVITPRSRGHARRDSRLPDRLRRRHRTP